MAKGTKKVARARTSAGLAFLGVEVSWSFGDGEARAVQLPRGAVVEVFHRHGFAYIDGHGEALEQPDAADTLRKAKRLIRSDVVVRQLQRPNRDTPLSLGVYRVDAVEGERGDNFVAGCRVRVDPYSGAAVALPPEGAAGDDLCMRRGEEMAKIANEWLHTVHNIDISNALCSIGAHLGWFTRRRNKGGVYYILAERCDAFIAVLDDLEALTEGQPDRHRFFPSVTEQYAAPNAVKAWKRESEHSLEERLRELKQDLARAETGTMREGTMLARLDECDELVARAELYRGLLAKASDDIAARVRKVKESFNAALNADVNESLSQEIEKATEQKEEKRTKRTRVKKSSKATVSDAFDSLKAALK